MGLTELLIGLAFLLIFEGLIPFISPQLFKKAASQLEDLGEGTVRVIGFILLMSGALILYLI
jgi:uncharacterized protein YjeT (DUF2065 family)|tara:strand:+ start:262 stop:447 length:186 start_codon:yes stop_codon:yes gene_type:complete